MPVELKILVVSVHGELRACWLVRKDGRWRDWTQDSGKRFGDRTWMLVDEWTCQPSRIGVRRHLQQRGKLRIILLVPVVNLHRTCQLLKTWFGIFVDVVGNFQRGFHVGRCESSESLVGRIVAGSVLLLLQLHQSCSLVDAEPPVLVHGAVPLGVSLVSCGLAKWTDVTPENWTANSASWSLESVTSILDLRLSVGVAEGTNIHGLKLRSLVSPSRTFALHSTLLDRV